MKFNLINTNYKLSKLDGIEYQIAGLTLPPHSLAGPNLCPSAGFCKAVCLGWFSGHQVTGTVRRAMLRRSSMLLDNPAGFREILHDDLARFAARAVRRGLKPLFRPNVATDIDWSELAAEFPGVTFYDYTKVKSRIRDVKRGSWPRNYELTYSVSERSHNRTIGSYLRAGFNVSAVFDTDYVPSWNRFGELPKSWRFDGQDWPVIDGDKHDIRLRDVDGSGVVVGLRFKGSRKLLGKAIERGFVLAT